MSLAMQTFETPEPITADLNVEAGRVRVIARDRVTTVVDVRPANEKRRADVEAAERTRVDLVAGRLDVRASRPRYLGLLGKPGSIEVVVQLPAGSQVRGQVSYGDVDVEGRVGDCAVKTSYGNLRVDEAAAVELHTSAGDITVGRAAGPAELSTSWGDVRIGEAGGETNIKTAGGDIRVEKACAATSARTSYGDVTVVEATGGSVTLATSYGNVRIGVPQGMAAYLDVTSEHGNVRNELLPSDDAPESQETVTVRARAKYGDITINRSQTRQGDLT